MLEKPATFESLIHTVQTCDLCERMHGRKKVLSQLNGNVNSKVVFIAEAPGRLGAECTGIPLCGDKTGDNFEKLLTSIGWAREDVFVTNSVLCNPQDNEGNNRAPTAREIKNCSHYLQMVIDLINPQVIVPLGVAALAALKRIYPHGYILNKDVAKALSWNNRTVFPLYHMSPKVTNLHRSFDDQKEDFRKLAQFIVVSTQ